MAPTPIGYVKILFRIEPNEYGYPPVTIEGVWASRVAPDKYRIENIPLYARGIAMGDVVSVQAVATELWAADPVEPGGHGTVRVLLYEGTGRDEILARLRESGCETESYLNIIAADVPPNAQIASLLGYLAGRAQRDELSYDEGCKWW